jgi:hypothetical protein
MNDILNMEISLWARREPLDAMSKQELMRMSIQGRQGLDLTGVV